ncbi:MAG TPA: E3 binding domain-containing protein [Planctomycetota bacterium]|nr:E3 binding domain-containing protein [Planctomycetota bacterium]
MASLQHLPYLGTAEDDVLFVEWLVDEGAAVHRGAPLATIETLKAAFDVEADSDGVLLRRLCDAGQRLPVAAAIAVVGQPGERCDEALLQQLLAAARAAAPAEPVIAAPPIAPEPFTSPAPAAWPAAPAARRRAAELGVDLANVVGTGAGGLVRTADVERAHAAAVPAQPRAGDAARGCVEPEFLARIREDRAAFAALRSDFKVQLYRRHGAQIGAGCRLGDGAVLEVERLVVGDGASFGPGCLVQAGQFEAGALLHFGARCRVRCTRLRFGDNAFFADDVEIGGGGAMDPEAQLVVGSHGFVGEHVHLNPCRRLALGDEVVMSRSAVVMTHSFGPSWLRGYPSRFSGVVVGDGAQIGIAATVFPGVEIGAGAVILSGSSVVTSVPPARLFGGVPAVDMKAAAQVLTARELAERAVALVREFARQLQLRGLPADVETQGERTTVSVARDDGAHRLEFVPRAAFAGERGVRAAETVWVAVDYDAAAFAEAPANTTAIALEPPRVRGPLGPLASAFREFLRKRGVRLHPRSWAYTGGWL